MRQTNQKVKELRIKIVENKIILRELKDDVKQYRQGILLRITEEKEETTGKPKFSNDAKREYELDTRLYVDLQYQQKIAAMENLEKETDLLQIEADYLTWEMTLSGHRNDDVVLALLKIDATLNTGVTVRK